MISVLWGNMSTKTQHEIERVCEKLKTLLIEKNRKYGDSALNPARVMSKCNAIEQILVRIDDKLNRIKQGAGLLATDEDVVMDLLGYFVLLKIALDRDCQESYLDTSQDEAGLWDPTSGPSQ